MIREFICVICPNGCELSAEIDGDKILSVEGGLCAKGDKYVEQEIIDPRRTISSSVKVRNGEIPLASVRLTNAIPKNKIFDAMEEIKKIEVDAPAKVGTILIHNILGLDSDLIITKNVNAFNN